MKNIVIIGGGTGTFTLLKGLRKYPSNNCVIVSSADDGGSTGRLRADLSVFPPGDLRQCLVGLSYTDEPMKELFNFRFDAGELAGHTAGNIIIAALEKITDSIEKALEIGGKMLNVRGQVIPVTTKPTLLSAVYENGKKVVGEHLIDSHKAISKQQTGIKNLQLSPKVSANPKALEAIKKADAIVFGPGDLYTSILPNILVKGMATAIKKSKAQKIFVSPIMSKPGQTDGFDVPHYLLELEKYLNDNINIVIANSGRPSLELSVKYKKSQAEVVKVSETKLNSHKVKIILDDLISKQTIKKVKGDPLPRSVIRHDSDKIAAIIWKTINSI